MYMLTNPFDHAPCPVDIRPQQISELSQLLDCHSGKKTDIVLPVEVPCPGCAGASHMSQAGMTLGPLGLRGLVNPLSLALDIP
jgi:hypothetical protein